MSNLLTPNETAPVLRCSLVTVYELIRGGRLRAQRLGHTYRVPDSALADLEFDPDTRERAGVA